MNRSKKTQKSPQEFEFSQMLVQEEREQGMPRSPAGTRTGSSELVQHRWRAKGKACVPRVIVKAASVKK